MLTPKPFQETGINFLFSNKAAYLGDDMGLGKTLQLLRAAYRVAYNVLNYKSMFTIFIVCPASLRFQWMESIRKDFPDVKNGERRQVVFEVISYNKLVDDVSEIKNEYVENGGIDILIADEAHYLKGWDSQRTQALLGKNSIGAIAKRIWLASGTPVLNRPFELYHILRALRPDLLGEYTLLRNFTKKFCGGSGNIIFDREDGRGCTNPEELGRMIAPFMLRRTKAEVLPELPALIEETISIPFDQKLFTEIMFEQNILREDFKNKNELPEIGSLSTLRRLLALSKKDAICDHLENILNSGKKVCTFGWHTELIDYVKEKLKNHNPVVVKGGMSDTEKKVALTSFTSFENCRLFIGQMKAAGEGLDGMQKVSDFVVIMEPDWTPASMSQVVGRVHRMGACGASVIVQYLVAAGTLEEQIMRTQESKKNNIERIL